MRLLPLFVLIASPAALSGQDPRLERRLDGDTRARVAAVIDSARAAGLPVEPLIDKALEGASKRAPGDRIVVAVRNLAAGLLAARDALGTADVAELDAAASALRAGVRAETLTRLRAARGRQNLTVPLAVLSDLVARGIPADSAAAFVLQLAAVAADDDFVAFQRNVDRDIALGAPPLAAAAVRVNATAADGFRGVNSLPGAPPPSPRKP
jgi:hypothetical protein